MASSRGTASNADLPQYVEHMRLVHGREVVIADENLAELRGCRAGQRWLHITGHRDSGSEKSPIALTHGRIAAAHGVHHKPIGTHRVLVYTLVEHQYGESVIEVHPADRLSYSMSLRLQAPVGG